MECVGCSEVGLLRRVQWVKLVCDQLYQWVFLGCVVGTGCHMGVARVTFHGPGCGSLLRI